MDYYEEDYVGDDAGPAIYRNANNLNVIFELLTISINLFHLLILLQKSLRANSIFILMIGICLSDILALTVQFYDLAVDRQWFKSLFDQFRMNSVVCIPPAYQVIDFFYTLKMFILNSTRPISIWLAILMALIRALSIIFPMNSKFEKLTKPGWTMLMILAISLFWMVYYLWDLVLLEMILVPNVVTKNCTVTPKLQKSAIRVFAVTFDNLSLIDSRRSWEYLVRIIPAIFYPLLTVPLIFELWRIQKKRKINNPKSENTLVLIFVMTLSFMLSEGLAGVSNFLLFSDWAHRRFTTIVSYADVATQVFDNLRTLNALSHFFVCLAMSSQYREAVKKMFCCCQKKKLVVKVEASNGNTLDSKTFDTINSRT